MSVTSWNSRIAIIKPDAVSAELYIDDDVI
jgi:hypothetical protein